MDDGISEQPSRLFRRVVFRDLPAEVLPAGADQAREVERRNLVLRLTHLDQAVADEKFDRHDQGGEFLLKERRVLERGAVAGEPDPGRVRLLHPSVLRKRFRKQAPKVKVGDDFPCPGSAQ